jgi:hypothetical protein
MTPPGQGCCDSVVNWRNPTTRRLRSATSLLNVIVSFGNRPNPVDSLTQEEHIFPIAGGIISTFPQQFANTRSGLTGAAGEVAEKATVERHAPLANSASFYESPRVE